MSEQKERPRQLEHPLFEPIETKDGQKLDKLVLHRLTIGDYDSISDETNKTARSIKLLAFSARLSEDDIRKMDFEDFNEASDKVLELLGFTDQSGTN